MKQKRKDKRSDDDMPTKMEKAVATYVRFNCPTTKTNFQGDDVYYFQGSKAVDLLMESKWKTGAKKTEILFTNRNTCINYMQDLMNKGMFWRARKLVPKRKDKDGDGKDKEQQQQKKKKQKKDEEPPAASSTTADAGAPAVEANENGNEGENKSEGKSPKKQKSAKKNGENEKETEEKGDSKEKEKKAKKIKLDIHADQVFKDSTDVYVWHFDPTSWTNLMVGVGIVVGSIALCLFPLWPPWMRLGVYYVSLVAMGFVGVLVALIVLRSIVFGLVWAVTAGKHHLWIFPNLTEDCGFFESFKPTYTHKYKGEVESGKKKNEEKEKDKDSDAKEKESSSEGGDKEEEEAQNTDTDRESEVEGEEVEGEGIEEESKEESSVPGTPEVRQRKGKGRKEEKGTGSDRNGTNDFEMVDKPDDEE